VISNESADVLLYRESDAGGVIITAEASELGDAECRGDRHAETIAEAFAVG